MSDISGTPLLEDRTVFGPATDFSGIPSDPMQRDYSQGLAQREAMVLADMGQGRERADMEVSREQQDQILAQLQRIMAENTLRTRNAPGSLGSSLQIPTLGETAANLDRLSFGAAFRIARAAGSKIFSWRGRNFTTKLR